jgi:2'-5' RNA ligase
MVIRTRTQRLFVAVDPAPAVRDRLADAIARVRPLAPRARWVDAAALHVTLAFLGDTPEDQVAALSAAIGAAARQHAPMDVRFAAAGTFGGKRPRILWVGVAGEVDALVAAGRDLGVALGPWGYVPERDLTPHLTLARAGDRSGDPALHAAAAALAGDDFGATRLEAMVLYRSELSPKGARYTAVATLPFGGGD